MPTDEPTTLRIAQDGLTGRTIVEMPNGEELPGVARVAVYLDNDTGKAEAHITVRGVALDVLCPTHATPAPRRTTTEHTPWGAFTTDLTDLTVTGERLAFDTPQEP